MKKRSTSATDTSGDQTSPDDGTDPSSLSDAEQEAVVGMLTEEDLRERSQKLSDAQEAWEDVAYMTLRKMPCPECAGGGAVSSGSLGDICPRCFGRRFIDQPGQKVPDMPPFALLRAGITAYGDALADRELPDGHLGKRGLALPAASTVVTMAQIDELVEKAGDRAKQLHDGGPAVMTNPKYLPKPSKAKGLAGEGDLGDFDDAELDEIESGHE